MRLNLGLYDFFYSDVKEKKIFLRKKLKEKHWKCVCVCLSVCLSVCVSVYPAFTAYISLTLGRILIKLAENV